MARKEITSVYMSAELKEFFRQLSVKTHVPMAQYIRIALEEYQKANQHRLTEEAADGG